MSKGVRMARAVLSGLGRYALRLASWALFHLASVPLWTGTKLVRGAEIVDGWSDALDPDHEPHGSQGGA